MIALLLLSIVSAGAPLPADGEVDEGIRGELRELDAATGPSWSATFDALRSSGEEAALLALEGFAQAGVQGRRSRARLVLEVGRGSCIDRVLGILGTGEVGDDPETRRLLVSFLGEPVLGEARAEARSAVLSEVVRSDPDPRVRADAVEALARSGLPEAARLLDRLSSELPWSERVAAATKLAELPSGRSLLAQRVQDAFGAGAALDPRLLAALLLSYGQAIAELPRGGLRPAERAPFLLGARHPAPAVRRASRSALDGLFARLLDLGAEERADDLLVRLGEDGMDRREVLYRRSYLGLSRGSNPGVVAAAARELQRLAVGSTDPEELTYLFYGIHLEAVARFAAGDPAAAHGVLERAKAIVHELLAERPDLRVKRSARFPSFPIAPRGGAVLVDRLHLLALVELWQGLTLLAAGDDPPGPDAFQHLRTAHEHLLSAQLRAVATDVEGVPDGWDSLLERDLAPGRLLMANRKLDPAGAWVDLELLLGRALATVAPLELPGFAPLIAGPAQLAGELLDPRRLEIRRSILDAELEQVNRRLAHFEGRRGEDPSAADRIGQLRFERQQVLRRRLRVPDGPALRGADRATEDFEPLFENRTPSLLALSLAADLRVEGRAREARELSERLLLDLRGGIPGIQTIWAEWVSARSEMSIASSLMDENRPLEAEEAGLAAVRRLEALENTLVARKEALVKDPDLGPRIARYLRETRSLRSGALLSLAVNANVRQNDGEKALGFFERAFELDQSDFMKVLLACYRARSGRGAEARAVLRGIRPSRRVYYNLACTYALLGEAETALDFLHRELEENHPTDGSRVRQVEWAREDPDLAALRGLPRFEELVGER